MKKGIRIISAVLSLIVMASCFSGCGKKAEKGSEELTSVSLWAVAGHSKTYMEKLIDDYNNGQGKKDGIKIEVTFIGSESYATSVELALQNGSAPDFFTTRELQKNIELGKIASIDELPGGDDIIKEYSDCLEDHKTTWDGKVYRVPKGANTMGIIYNVDMFKKAGIVDKNGNARPPETFDEMREVAKKLTDVKKKQYGIIYPRKWSSWADSDIVYTAAPSFGRLDYDYVNGEFDMTHTKKIIQNIIDITNDGSAFPGATNIDNDAARAYFAEGNIGMKIGMSFDVGVLKTQFPAKVDWDVAPLPVLDKDNKYKQRLYYDYSYVMSSGSIKKVGGEKMEKVFKFLNGKKFIIEAYKNEMVIPYDYSIVKDIEIDKSMKQWKNFCKMVDISVDYPMWPERKMAGMENFATKVSRILDGELSIDKGLEQYNADALAGMNAYYQENPNAWRKPSEYNIPDWNAKR